MYIVRCDYVSIKFKLKPSRFWRLESLEYPHLGLGRRQLHKIVIYAATLVTIKSYNKNAVVNNQYLTGVP
jgi:hypothetical protein